jgi:hypothetical protein
VNVKVFRNGQWVPAVPEPLRAVRWTGLFHCSCGRGFWRRGSYDDHHLLAHVVTPFLFKGDR